MMPNLFDLSIIAFFFIIVLLCFVGGVGRVLAALVGIYCSAVVAAKFYRPFSEIVLSKLFPDMSSFTGDLVAFLFLMLVIGVSVSVGLGRNWAVVRLPQKLGVFNNIGG